MATDNAEFVRARRLHQAGDLRGAEEAYRGLLRAEPRDARVWFALGQACDAGRRLTEAAACFRQGVEIEPKDAEAHFLLGNVLLQQGQHQAAEPAYRRCLELQPDHALALGNLGFVLNDFNRLEDARACYEKALQLRPDLAEVHHNLGNVLREQGHLDQALACYRQALALRPEYGKAYINRGIALVALGRIDEAIADLERGVQLKADLADAHTSLGAALSVQQRLDEALACYQRALTLKPDHAEAAWNQSLIWLLQGDFARGWPAYKWRWKCKRTTAIPAFTQPRWDGTPLNGRTILLYGEQGLGDTLHFIRYAPLVKAMGGRVIVNCQNALLRLLSRTPGIDGLVGWGGKPPPAFDVWTPLMSLPALFGTTLETIPAAVPYLFADPELVKYWHRQLAPVRGFRVGIAWRGSPQHAWDRHRSVDLTQFEPLARIDGVQLISLQKGPGAEQLRALNGRFPVLTLGDLVDESSGPFMDTAAVLANLDLVISVDSALAHLAGGLAIPAWLALTFTPDWRWLLGREDSVWYPTLRLFRQTRFGDWAGVFARLAGELQTKSAAHKPVRALTAEISAGELIDKITILEIKSERLSDPDKLRNVRTELAALTCTQNEEFAPRRNSRS